MKHYETTDVKYKPYITEQYLRNEDIAKTRTTVINLAVPCVTKETDRNSEIR